MQSLLSKFRHVILHLSYNIIHLTRDDMQEKVIGILGGMGPEATLNCFEKIIRNTPAQSDPDHLPVIIINNPRVPDRIRAILENGPSPLPALIEGCSSLKKAGADFVIIPCVTAHYFLNELQENVELPIISIVDAVIEHIHNHHPQLKKIGLLATSVTIKSRIFQNSLTASGIETVVCSEKVQQRVIAAIHDIKSNRTSRSREAITHDLTKVAGHLVERGAQGIIAACTEIPLALTQADVTVPYFDSLLILARAAICRAGREPIGL